MVLSSIPAERKPPEDSSMSRFSTWAQGLLRYREPWGSTIKGASSAASFGVIPICRLCMVLKIERATDSTRGGRPANARSIKSRQTAGFTSLISKVLLVFICLRRAGGFSRKEPPWYYFKDSLQLSFVFPIPHPAGLRNRAEKVPTGPVPIRYLCFV